MSKDYALIKAWYDMGLWDVMRMRNAVEKGKITESEYEAVTGTKYAVSQEQ